MNKRNTCGGGITRDLPYNKQCYKLSQRIIRTRLDRLRREFYPNGSSRPLKSLYQKKNAFKRLQLESGKLICCHCYTELVANNRIFKNRKKMHCLRCATLLDMIPYTKPNPSQQQSQPQQLEQLQEL